MDDQPLAVAKEVAIRTGRTLRSLIEDALRQALNERRQTGRDPVRLLTFAGDGLEPGMDLDDSGPPAGGHPRAPGAVRRQA